MILTEGRGFQTPMKAVPAVALLEDAIAFERAYIDQLDYVTDDGVSSVVALTFNMRVPEDRHDDIDPDGTYAEPMVLQTYVFSMEMAQKLRGFLDEAIAQIVKAA